MIGLLLLWSCSADDGALTPGAPPSSETDTAATVSSFSYLALGDSYTIGTGLPASSGRFPVQLRDRLNAAQEFEGGTVQIIAQNGWTTGQLINVLDQSDKNSDFDLVSLLIGVNNQFQNRPEDEYANDFQILTEKALALAGNEPDRVFILSIPDYGVTPFASNLNAETVAAEIDAFNAINSVIAAEYGISYFDITEISRAVAGDPGMLAPDNLHPSAEQYGLWVDSFYQQVKLKLHD